MANEEAKIEEGKDKSGPGIVLAALVCLLLGSASGGAFGYFFLAEVHAPAIEKEEAIEASAVVVPEPKGEGRFPDDAIEIPLAPIITGIGTEKKSKVRLEMSIVAIAGTPLDTPMKNEIREDAIALLWGLSLSHIDSGRGFQRLRAELSRRARVRGSGAVLGVLIGNLVVQ